MKNHLREEIGYFLIFLSVSLFVTPFTFANGATLSPGQKTFEGKCAQCHGKDAKGLAKMAGVLQVEPAVIDLTKPEAVSMTSEAMIKQVTNGKNKMPKFKKVLTVAQIQDVVKYLRTIQAGVSK